MTTFVKSALFSIALACGTSAFAQSQGALQSDGTTAPAQTQAAPTVHQKNAGHDLKHMTKQLGLTADQSTQLQPILADRDTQLNTLAADATLDPKSKHKQMHRINQDADGKINAVLTPAQQQQFTAMKAAHHQKEHPTAPPATT